MPLYYSNFKSFSNKISRIFWFEQLFCMAFISYTERPISALSSVGEARAGLTWVDFNFVMSQQAPIRWSLNSWAAQANHGHPTILLLKQAPQCRPGSNHDTPPYEMLPKWLLTFCDSDRVIYLSTDTPGKGMTKDVWKIAAISLWVFSKHDIPLHF